MTPFAWTKLGAAAAVACGLLAGGWTLRGWRDSAERLAEERAAAVEAYRKGELALKGAQILEDERAAIRNDLRATQNRLAQVLAQPVPQCPALKLGDVVLPPGALDRVLSASGQRTGPAATQPDGSLRRGATDP